MRDLQSPPSLIVISNEITNRAEAMHLAGKLGLECLCGVDPSAIESCEFALVFDDTGVSLQQTGKKAPGPIRADFISGAVNHRRKFGGGKGQMIAKAVGVKSGVYPKVLDVTAGLGKDAFVLATLGCNLTLVERSPIVQAILADGLQRAKDYARSEDLELASLLERMYLQTQDSLAYLETLADGQKPDVIYLDPMFPERSKSADVKKDMKAFHLVVGKDLDADQLLDKCLAVALYRVVVKRPRKAPNLAGRAPSYQLEGKSSRYDIYTLQKLPAKLPEQ